MTSPRSLSPKSGSPHPPEMNTFAPRLSRVLLATMASGTIIAQAQQPGTGQEYPDNRNAASASLGSSALGLAFSTSRDVGSHLYRSRSGIRPGNHIIETEAPIDTAGSKGGMASAKGGAKVASIAVPAANRWQVYGSLFYFTEDRDGESYRPYSKKDDKKDDKKKSDKYSLTRAVAGGSLPTTGVMAGVNPGTTDSSLEVYGGSVGIEYQINRNWATGVALSASSGDLDMDSTGSTDIDSVAVSPYVSFYRADTVGSADLWAGLMYSYGMHSFETKRNTGGGVATGSPDAETHTVEFNVGLNFGEEEFVHGPYAGLRYITGTIDSYTELGPGGTFFGEQNVDSLVSILGYQASWKLRSGNGYWVPQVRVGWEHEFEDGNTTSFGIPLDSSDSDLAVVGTGVGYYWDNGWNVGLDYEGRFGSTTESHYGGVRAGKEF